MLEGLLKSSGKSRSKAGILTLQRGVSACRTIMCVSVWGVGRYCVHGKATVFNDGMAGSYVLEGE